MTVRHRTEWLLNDRFFEDAFKNEMNGDVADTVCDAFFAAMNEYDEATRLERIGCMAKLLARHDAAEDWLAVANEIKRLRKAMSAHNASEAAKEKP